MLTAAFLEVLITEYKCRGKKTDALTELIWKGQIVLWDNLKFSSHWLESYFKENHYFTINNSRVRRGRLRCSPPPKTGSMKKGIRQNMLQWIFQNTLFLYSRGRCYISIRRHFKPYPNIYCIHLLRIMWFVSYTSPNIACILKVYNIQPICNYIHLNIRISAIF